MQRLEVSCAVGRIYKSLGIKGLKCSVHWPVGSKWFATSGRQRTALVRNERERERESAIKRN